MRPDPNRLLDYREYPILYVDDEPENLRIFELTFRREFSVLTAAGGEQALEVVHAEPVALVLSDHRMPGMTGVDFLARVRDIDPKTVRMLVTAYGDAETLGNAINNGSVYRFVPKPWSPEDMRVNLRRGIEMYALDREREGLLRELSLLNRVSRSINQELAVDPLLDLLLEVLVEELDYDAGGILFFDSTGERLAWAALSPADDAVAAGLRELEIGASAAPSFVRRLRDGEAQLLPVDRALDLEGPVRRWVTEVAAEEILVVPLMGRSGVLGALAVDNRRGGRRFGSEDRTLLEGLSTQAAIALENARLVSDLRRSRDEVLRADRLGTLGRLAAGLAREIGAPLESIQSLLADDSEPRAEDDPGSRSSRHESVCRELARARELVDAMRQLASEGDGVAPREALEIGALAEEVVALLEPRARAAGVGLELEVDPQTPKIVVVRDGMHQVCLNLLLCALRATPSGETVRMRVLPEPDGGAARLEVCDRGPGMSPSQMEHLLDPFASGEPGSGDLGLLVCQRIVSEQGGTLEIGAAEEGGTRFGVRIPAG